MSKGSKKKLKKHSRLRKLLTEYAEDAITDEHAGRLIEPVMKMIREGKFDRQGTGADKQIG